MLDPYTHNLSSVIAPLTQLVLKVKQGVTWGLFYETLVLAYAVLGCVWILLAYARFISVVMVSECEGSVCGSRTAYS